MSEELKPCPFCGAGKFDITEVPLNRTPSMDGRPSPIISASVRHWCEPKDRHPRGLNVSVHGYDRASAIAAWNRRASPSTEGEGEAYIENDHARFQDEIDRLTRELEAARVDARRKPMEGHSKPLEVMARALPYVTIPLKVTEGGKVTTNGTTVSGLLNAGLGGGPFVFLLVEQVCQAIASAALTALEASGRAVVPREPTEAMLAAGDSAIPRAELDEHGMRMMGREVALECWTAMLATHTQEKDA